NPERGGLPRAGLAPADDVPAGEDRLEHCRLHRGGSRISPLGDSLAQLLGERKISEAGGGDVIAHLGLNTKELACIAPHLPGIQMSPRSKARNTKKPAKPRAPRKARDERKEEEPLEPEVLEPEPLAGAAGDDLETP